MTLGFRQWRLAAALAFCGLIAASCQQPVLETESCIAARDSVKRLYSIYLDSEGGSKANRLSKVGKFLSDGLSEELARQGPGDADYLTKSEVMPKASRVGSCREVNGNPQFEVLLFWRKDEVNVEKKIIVSVKNEDDWVTDRVTQSN